jgi:outer membrane protein assembly factor BamB/dienelactone hydrolase
LKWQFPPAGSEQIVGAINATPTVVNGYVYFGTSTSPMFYKLKPNGEVCWKFEAGDSGRKSMHRAQHKMGLSPRDGIYSSALVTDDSVFITDVMGVAYCLDRKTGKEKWRVNTKADDFPGAHAANLLMASPIVADRKVIFAGGAYEHAAAARQGYPCCNGRGFVMALDPADGRLVWKYNVGPEPEKFDPPVRIKSAWGEREFQYGPSTSSVWSTPTYDAQTETIFFGTDVHNSPRRPTEGDPRNYTEHSAAVIAVNAATGREKWVCQTNRNDIYNHTLPAYDPETGYKDQSVGDSRLILDGKLEKQDGKLLAEVREVREVVDPIDQTSDLLNAIHWVQREKLCDPDRIGLWGSSFSGGHVIYAAARDTRIKALVSQVGSMDARWTIQDPTLRQTTFSQGTARTRGELDYPKPGAKWSGFTGVPILEKFMRYAPLEDIERCDHCAKLFVIAENEELFDNKEHAILAHQRAGGVKKLVTVKGIKHYGIYYEKRKEAQQLALDWFNQHLK